MKRLFFVLALIAMLVLSAFAGHTRPGGSSGTSVYCEWSTPQYPCFDDETGELLPEKPSLKSVSR